MSYNDKISIDTNGDVPPFLTPAIKGLAAIILLLILSIPVLAHSPSQVLLAYDDMNQTLNVTITHTSTNPSHYVREVVMQPTSRRRTALNATIFPAIDLKF